MLFDKIALEPEEKIIKTVREHWFIISTQIAVITIFALMPVFVSIGIMMWPPDIRSDAAFFTLLPLFIFGIAGWLLLSLIAATTAWSHYFLDLWVITDRRIIVIEQVRFFDRRVSNFRLERLQDIKATVRGLIPTLLNYGTVSAQTASASENNFKSPNLPAPRELQALIQIAMDARLAKFNQPTGLGE